MRRSSRVRNPPSYFGDYVSFAEESQKNNTRKQARTLTEDSNVESVIERGETIRAKRGRPRRSVSEPRKASVNDPTSPSQVVISPGRVVNLEGVLLPFRPLIRETVQNERCQWLDRL